MITQSGRMLLLLFFGSRKRRKAGKKERKTLSPLHLSVNNSLAQAPRLALRLQQREDVALADGALDVAHEEAVLVVKELDADVGLKRKTRPLEERRRRQQQQLRAAAAAQDRRFSIKQSMNHSSPFFLPVHASPCGR